MRVPRLRTYARQSNCGAGLLEGLIRVCIFFEFFVYYVAIIKSKIEIESVEKLILGWKYLSLVDFMSANVLAETKGCSNTYTPEVSPAKN